MARQLHAEGQRVDLLVLMDAVTLVYPAHLRLLHSGISRLGDLVRLGRDKQLRV
jgi:thioesterase domain-containing protein